MNERKDLKYYLALPYTVQLTREDEQTWFARVVELPGCMSEGDSAQEAAEMILDAMAGWIELALEDRRPIPEPRPEEDYSGKFVVRVPHSLHRELVEAADRESVSLNQYINVALAHTVNRTAPSSVTNAGLNWPGLKSSVHQALLAAGLAEEAGELDEKLFATHTEQFLSQVESAVKAGCFQDALWALGMVVNALRPAMHTSPLLAAFYRTVILLSDQIEMVARLQKGVIEEILLRSRINEMVQGSAMALGVIRQVNVDYSAASQALSQPSSIGSDVLSQLFVKRPTAESKW